MEDGPCPLEFRVSFGILKGLENTKSLLSQVRVKMWLKFTLNLVLYLRRLSAPPIQTTISILVGCGIPTQTEKGYSNQEYFE